VDINLICFGIAKDIVGASATKLNLAEPFTVEHLKKTLVQLYPKFQNINSFQIAVNQTYADNTTPLNSTDEVVVIPPVSGG